MDILRPRDFLCCASQDRKCSAWLLIGYTRTHTKWERWCDRRHTHSQSADGRFCTVMLTVSSSTRWSYLALPPQSTLKLLVPHRVFVTPPSRKDKDVSAVSLVVLYGFTQQLWQNGLTAAMTTWFIARRRNPATLTQQYCKCCTKHSHTVSMQSTCENTPTQLYSTALNFIPLKQEFSLTYCQVEQTHSWNYWIK